MIGSPSSFHCTPARKGSVLSPGLPMNRRIRKNLQGCFPGPRQFTLEQTEWPGEPTGSDILVECLYSLISAGTELAIFTQTHRGFSQPSHPYARYPFFPGYAAAGRVRAAGPEAAFQEDDIVFYAGRHARFARISPACLTLKAAPDTPIEWIPFTQIATVAGVARWVSTTRPGGVAAVFGLGLVGNLASQLFQLAGFRVIGVDRSQARCNLALETGLAETVVAKENDPVEAVRQTTRGQGADVVIEATGNPAAAGPALDAAKRGGEAILLGSTRGTVELDVYSLIHHKGLTVRGAHASLVPSALPAEGGLSPKTALAAEMLRLIESEKLRVAPLISRTIAPEEMAATYARLADEPDPPTGVLVDWGECAR